MSVLNVLVVVTVTVTTRCPPGQLVAGGLVQSSAGVVGLNVPVSDAHWHNLDAVAVMPGVFVAASAVVSIPAMSALRAGVWAPYWAPALAAFVNDWAA